MESYSMRGWVERLIQHEAKLRAVSCLETQTPSALTKAVADGPVWAGQTFEYAMGVSCSL